jgi:entericidin B
MHRTFVGRMGPTAPLQRIRSDGWRDAGSCPALAVHATIYTERAKAAGNSRMKRFFFVIVCIATIAASGCNTVRGVGKDIERAGEVIQGAD